MTSSILSGGVHIDRTFSTIRELVDFGVALVDYYVARITEWTSDGAPEGIPVSELTNCNEDAFHDLYRLALTFRTALGRISGSAENHENWAEPPSGALVEAVTAGFLDPLRNFRHYFWRELEWKFKMDVEEKREFVLESDIHLARLYAVASKDIVQTTLIINFLQQLRETLVEPSGVGLEEEVGQRVVAAG